MTAKDSLARLEAAIGASETMGPKEKAELVRLLSKLKGEMKGLSKTHDEHAQSIAGLAEVAVHEATRKAKAPDLQELTVKGLESSVTGFEASHPVLVRTVNEICSLLSRIGI